MEVAPEVCIASMFSDDSTQLISLANGNLQPLLLCPPFNYRTLQIFTIYQRYSPNTTTLKEHLRMTPKPD